VKKDWDGEESKQKRKGREYNLHQNGEERGLWRSGSNEMGVSGGGF